ncbi:hypothetical protein GQ473_06740 [archaeon]|nr:hypothetical protein [archaeon]
MDVEYVPESKNKVLAGLSYLFLLLGILGVLIDVVIHYSTKNKYAKYHSGQAVWLMILFLILGLIAIAPLYFVISSGMNIELITYGINMVKIIVIFLSSAAAFAGKDFKIPIASQILEK